MTIAQPFSRKKITVGILIPDRLCNKKVFAELSDNFAELLTLRK